LYRLNKYAHWNWVSLISNQAERQIQVNSLESKRALIYRAPAFSGGFMRRSAHWEWQPPEMIEVVLLLYRKKGRLVLNEPAKEKSGNINHLGSSMIAFPLRSGCAHLCRFGDIHSKSPRRPTPFRGGRNWVHVPVYFHSTLQIYLICQIHLHMLFSQTTRHSPEPTVRWDDWETHTITQIGIGSNA